jgi:hypothetical protein
MSEYFLIKALEECISDRGIPLTFRTRMTNEILYNDTLHTTERLNVLSALCDRLLVLTVNDLVDLCKIIRRTNSIDVIKYLDDNKLIAHIDTQTLIDLYMFIDDNAEGQAIDLVRAKLSLINNVLDPI